MSSSACVMKSLNVVRVNLQIATHVSRDHARMAANASTNVITDIVVNANQDILDVTAKPVSATPLPKAPSCSIHELIILSLSLVSRLYT